VDGVVPTVDVGVCLQGASQAFLAPLPFVTRFKPFRLHETHVIGQDQGMEALAGEGKGGRREHASNSFPILAVDYTVHVLHPKLYKPFPHPPQTAKIHQEQG